MMCPTVQVKLSNPPANSADGPFARVFHEVAIPTIARAVGNVRTLDCAGSCCTPIAWEVAQRQTCSHKVDLAMVNASSAV